jgi:hypothetical protein
MDTINPEAANKETKLSPAQARLLAAAAAHPRGIVEPTSKATERAGHNRTVEALAGQGLIRQLSPQEGEAAREESSPGAPSWIITAAGLRAIGLPDVMLSEGALLESEESAGAGDPDEKAGGSASQQPAEDPVTSEGCLTSSETSGARTNKSEVLLGLLRQEARAPALKR